MLYACQEEIVHANYKEFGDKEIEGDR